VEEALAAIWAEVLGVERVGRQDNFFELGGHSLAAMQITALLTQRYGYQLPIRQLFEHHTLQALASAISPADLMELHPKQQRFTEMDLLMREFEI
jgi:acyl carrier protein